LSHPAFQSGAFQANAFHIADGVCVPAFQPTAFQTDAFQVCTDTATTTTGGGWLPWLEKPRVKKAREDTEKAKRKAWRDIEKTIEDAYLEATGQKRPAIRKQVKEALKEQDPRTVQAIARMLTQSENTQAQILAQRIEAQMAELQNLSIVYERMIEQAMLEFMQQEEDALAVLLLS